MKIFLCQIKPKVGDLKGNFSIIKNCYKESLSRNSDICLVPELSICGYMSEDLFIQEDYIKEIEYFVNKLISLTKDTCLLIAAPVLEKDNVLYNAIIAAQNGLIIGKTFKHILPNYGVFDEKRYFASGVPSLIKINGINVGIPICEDIWFLDICNQLKQKGAQIFLVPNGSPYSKGKMNERIKIVKQRYKETNIPIIYCNQVIGQDGIIFDGRSFCYDGKLKIVCKAFETDHQMIIFSNNKFISSNTYKPFQLYDEIFHAMLLGLKDYVYNNGFNKVILGLSGGIDSAIVAVVAAKLFGKDNITAYMLPSKFTSKESMEDANRLALNLGINLEYIDISDIFNSFIQTLNKNNQIEDGSITYQNIQSRIRGTILMAKANENKSLLITTGNKSEYATGYATIYGDMNGAFNPIKDIYKTQLYNLAIYINQNMGNIIPENIINKSPTAELSFNQKDSDSLPDYNILDKILEDYIENRIGYKRLYKKYGHNLASNVVNLVKNSEFKRRQSAPGVKISTINFEKDRRFPITNLYKK